MCGDSKVVSLGQRSAPKQEQIQHAQKTEEGPGNENEISMYAHCGKCLEEWKSNPTISSQLSPGEYASLNVGWTPRGLQVWCNRHDVNVMHIDFEGHKHPANTTRKGA